MPTEPAIPRPIRLIVADVDGCLSKGSKNPIPLALVQKLIETNELSKCDPAVPAITFCTGRPQPYVECLIQVTHGHMPALCESGTVFFDPLTHEVVLHPAFGAEERALLARLHARLERDILGPAVTTEPGKVTHVTLLLSPPLKPTDLLPRAQAAAREFGGVFEIELSRICLHFLFRHLNKGTGIEWLASHTGIAVDEMAGIGDALPDIPFLSRVALGCAPANAMPEVKQACQFVSERDDADATIEFIDHVIARNRALACGAGAGLAAR
jgi:hydroxymethylpyrimidine pyrophosphatase-like HAD family hydrolase